MKILLVEDEDEKVSRIKCAIQECLEDQSFSVAVVGTINDALVAMGQTRFEVIIADLVLPQMGESPSQIDATPQWCEQIENHWSGKLSSWIVMTGFAEIASEARQSFARHGVAVLQYDDSDTWKAILKSRLKELAVEPPLDFVIVCALEKERAGLRHCPGIAVGDLSAINGMDCQELRLGSFRGVAIVLPSAGLISSAIATAKAAETFNPRAITMCGICGGIEGEVQLGALVIPDISWNYQSGKIISVELKPEPIQTAIPPKLRAHLQQLASKEVSRKLRSDLMWPELENGSIHLAPMVSGSQVVADIEVGQGITEQNRKVVALDMEVASVYAAARDFFNGGGIFFAAKTVVDLANTKKDDRLHEYGCVLSARFVVEALGKVLESLKNDPSQLIGAT